MLEFLPNALLQGFLYGIAVLGLGIAFRVIKYPDLTAEGSFMLGSTVFAHYATQTGNWQLPLVYAVVSGALAGLTSSLLNSWLGVSRLLTGILTSMIAYSVAFRLLQGRSNIGLSDVGTMFSSPRVETGTWLYSDGYRLLVAAGIGILVLLFVFQLLRSEFGLFLRATGNNQHLVRELNHSPAAYRAIGLALANSLVALAGALVSAQQGFADINLSSGIIITLVAGLVIGEELVRLIARRQASNVLQRAMTPFVGATVYFALYLLILKASVQQWLPIAVQPTDLKILSAILVIGIIALRRRSAAGEELLPL